MDLVLNPKLVEALVGKLLEFHLEHNRRIFEAAAKEIDIFMLGDDFGSENGLLISLPMFRRFFKPALRCLIDSAKKFNWSKGNMGSKKVIEIWWVRIGYFLKIGLKF